MACFRISWKKARRFFFAPPVAATEKVREVLRDDGASFTWGADSPAEEIAARGEPFAATVLSGAGHSLLAFDSEGRPLGSHLSLLHVRGGGLCRFDDQVRAAPREER